MDTKTIIGQQFFNNVISINLNSQNTSNSDTLRGPGYDLKVNTMFVRVWSTVGGTLTAVNPDVDLCDPVTLQIEDLGNSNSLFASNAIDVFALNNITKDLNFKGFEIPAESNLKFTVAQAGTNFTAPLRVDICISGQKI